MALIWIPNLSEGRNAGVIRALVGAVSAEGAVVLDVHSDADHNRSVITATGPREDLVSAAAALADGAAELIDLTEHQGTHPRIGALDVSPFVPHETSMGEAVDTARLAAEAIHQRTGLPVYLYGEAATRAETRNLPDLRRGGLEGLAARAAEGLAPDAGPATIDRAKGVVCVGARGPLIAFNVWLAAPVEAAKQIAASVRGPAVRALGMEMSDGSAQVSMNLIDPPTMGIDGIFDVVRRAADHHGVEVTATEIVGLVEERFLPNPNAQAARLLREPGRSLESELAKS
jgi:glutamate formiminotransferase